MTGSGVPTPQAAILADLAAQSASAPDAGAVVVTVVGESGSGKSHLLRAAYQQHRDAYGADRAFWAQALRWESPQPGAVIAQLLQRESATDAELLAALAGPAPTLVVIDDAHDGDADSQQRLISLLTHRRGLPVVLLRAVVSARDTLGLAVEQVVTPAGLTAAEAGQLAVRRGVVMHPLAAERLVEHTAGNPRAVLHLLAETPAGRWSRPDPPLSAPQSVIDEVAGRIAACPPAGRSLTQAIAVLRAVGPATPDEPGVAARLAGVQDLLAAVDEAVAAGLIRVEPGVRPDQVMPALPSPMHRAAVLAGVGLAEAGAAHRRAAELVADPLRRLQHLVAATPMADAFLADRLDALAAAHAARGEWSEAAELFAQSSRLTVDGLDRDRRLTRSVDALLAAGDAAAATALVPTVESLRETPLRDATLAYLAVLRGRAVEADMRLDRAWEIVNVHREAETAGMIAQRRVLDSLVRCQGDELVTWADTAISLAGEGAPAATEAAVIKGLGLAWSGQTQPARTLYAELTAGIRHGANAQRVAMGRGWLELALDDVDSARSSLETAVSMAQLGGSSRITQWALAWLARVQFATGEWDSALVSVARGRELAADSGIALVVPLMEWTAAQIYSLRGDWTSADRAVGRAQVSEGSYPMMQVPAMLARAARAEASADYGKVTEVLTSMVALAESAPGLAEPGFWPWVDPLANALVLEGRLEAADQLLTGYEGVARARGHRSVRARLGYARGRLLGAQGDLPAARRAFDEALDLLDGLPLRYDRARVTFAYGQTLRRAGKRRAADSMITRSRELHESLGATTYVARCDRELRAGGVAGVRGSSVGVDLTPQEEAVSTLVAQGMSNREVAAELYISAKTVQYHLTRIFAKLGLRSRTELAALLNARSGEGDAAPD
ncbi:helix-turn-helix transcriptional regulator [Gordonia caeni]|uniref:LuxR family transcriptional regulator n=1 Tax=Gordonia caeni TaxID=1007097 RepID=A0ABP7NU64_9ACTN